MASNQPKDQQSCQDPDLKATGMTKCPTAPGSVCDPRLTSDADKPRKKVSFYVGEHPEDEIVAQRNDDTKSKANGKNEGMIYENYFVPLNSPPKRTISQAFLNDYEADADDYDVFHMELDNDSDEK